MHQWSAARSIGSGDGGASTRWSCRVAEREPGASDARDHGSGQLGRLEEVGVELLGGLKFAFAVHAHVLDAHHLHGCTAGCSICSMNSRRMPPGASTKAILLTPKVPETTLGPHST